MRRLFFDAQIAPCSESERLAVRHALPVIDKGETWHESYAAGCWLVNGHGAPVTLSHDGETVGHVTALAAFREWHRATCVIEDGPHFDAARALIRVGQPVSIDGRSIRRDDNDLNHVRRHTLATLDAIAILDDRQLPAFPGAKILSVYEPKPAKPVAPAIPDDALRPGVMCRRYFDTPITVR